MTSPDKPGRKAIASALGTGILVAAGLSAYLWWPRSLPPMDAPTTELVTFATTDRFASLPESKQVAYVDAMIKRGVPALVMAAAQVGLTEHQRQKAFDNSMQAGMTLVLGPQLDTWIKLDEKGRREFAKKVAQEAPMRPFGGPTRPGGRAMTPARVKQFVENTPPARRAAMAEFISDITKAQQSTDGP